MAWFVRKLDMLLGALFGGVFLAAASQFGAFVQQYVQRLGGHLDEARRHLTNLETSERYRDLEPTARETLLSDARSRVAEIEAAFRAIAEADLLTLPYAFLRHFESTIAARAWESFQPALPVDLTGVVYAVTGAVLGLIVYELVKLPFAWMAPRRRGPRLPRNGRTAGQASASSRRRP